ncbi:MAG: uroporphyrinogen decarboxylase [Planctomycetes bacterium]|nr:uroporphyrinogen decarboxylase [Planctomycetota bacterium]
MATMTTNSLILDAARGKRTERTPVWLMRQAGRFDPEYQALKQRHGLPLEEMFCTADLAAEMTCLPRRFGVDALILYQDILTPLAPMGAPFVFRPGPVLEEPVRTADDIARLRLYEPREELPFIPRSIELVRSEIDGELPLFGFAGAPLTLAAFILEGGSPAGKLDRTRALMESDPGVMHDLLGRLTKVTIALLEMEIEAGVEAVQLFESVSDLLTDDEYLAFAHPWQARIFTALEGSVPRILFAKEQPRLDLMRQTGADVLSVGRCVDLAAARADLGPTVALQGNVDNLVLRDGTPEQIEAAVRQCVHAGGHHGHILNLNHGILKDTPIDNVRRLIDTCRATRIADAPDDDRKDE